MREKEKERETVSRNLGVVGRGIPIISLAPNGDMEGIVSESLTPMMIIIKRFIQCFETLLELWNVAIPIRQTNIREGKA